MGSYADMAEQLNNNNNNHKYVYIYIYIYIIYIYIYIIREDYEPLYANKFDKLEKRDNFIETYTPPKLNQEEINCMIRPITKSEIGFII